MPFFLPVAEFGVIWKPVLLLKALDMKLSNENHILMFNMNFFKVAFSQHILN